MRVSLPLPIRISRKWTALGRSLASENGSNFSSRGDQPPPTFRDGATRFAELPANTKNPDAPAPFRRFQTAPRFSIYKLTEMQRTIDEGLDYNLVFYVPTDALARVKNAIFETGAGTIGGGKYTRCSFQTLGTGQFQAMEGATPPSGRLGNTEVVESYRVEIMCHGKNIAKAAVRALLASHPYGSPSYAVYKMEFGFLEHQLLPSTPYLKGSRLSIPRSPALHPSTQSVSPKELGIDFDPPTKQQRQMGDTVKDRITSQFSPKPISTLYRFRPSNNQTGDKLQLTRDPNADSAGGTAPISSTPDKGTIFIEQIRGLLEDSNEAPFKSHIAETREKSTASPVRGTYTNRPPREQDSG
ncbi:hypothetical protein TWF694_003457 [Orbilia ellipsospora]|uniref:ATP phosphoribosyltransferase n=1 Tax=Orbilia ellipsospora TaxID=2528407 RepID=A0AAV9WYB2_9PEZI